MPEKDAIERTDEPLTVERLTTDLRDLGAGSETTSRIAGETPLGLEGETVLVHSSLSALGWVAGGPPAVVDALMEAVTSDGTLVMPTHSTQYTDPTYWENPPVPDDWVEDILSSRPPYRPDVTPTRGMGAIAECFRTYPGVLRSRHPTYSFGAWGADAESVVGDHEYDHGLGEGSPLARVYDRDGFVLMLGTQFDTNTSLHLSEHRADREWDVTTESAPVLDDEGERAQVTFEELDYDSGDFEEAGQDFEKDHPEAVTRGTVGAADVRVVAQRALVDYGAEWFEKNRE